MNKVNNVSAHVKTSSELIIVIKNVLIVVLKKPMKYSQWLMEIDNVCNNVIVHQKINWDLKVKYTNIMDSVNVYLDVQVV